MMIRIYGLRLFSLAQRHNPTPNAMYDSRILLLEPTTPTAVHPSCVMINSLIGARDVIWHLQGHL
jgi:hypothetical protein